MSYGLTKNSGLEACYIEGKDPNIVSSSPISVKFKYNKAQLPPGFGVTSTDDTVFNFSQGSTYFLIASVYWIINDRSERIHWSFGFYDEDNSEFIGTPGQITLGYTSTWTSPQYSHNASLVLFKDSISSGGKNITVRFKEGIEPYPATSSKFPSTSDTTGTFEGQNIFQSKPMTSMPTLTILKGNN